MGLSGPSIFVHHHCVRCWRNFTSAELPIFDVWFLPIFAESVIANFNVKLNGPTLLDINGDTIDIIGHKRS